MQGPCIDCAGTDRAGSVHQVFIVQGPCMECSFVGAWTVQGPCIDCPELNDQLAENTLEGKIHVNCEYRITDLYFNDNQDLVGSC